MRKILLATTIISALSTLAFASEDNFNKKFYLKLEGGATQFQKIKEKTLNVKMKTKPAAEVSIGGGMYLMDKFRVELSASHAFNPTFKYSGSYSIPQFIATPIGKEALNKLISFNFTTQGPHPRQSASSTSIIKNVLNDLISNPSSITTLNQAILKELNAQLRAGGATAAQIAVVTNSYTSL